MLMVPVPMASGQIFSSQHMAHVECEDVPISKKINSENMIGIRP